MPAALADLPDVFEAAGLGEYMEVADDFLTHWRPYNYVPWGTIWHHTASSINSTRSTVTRVIHDGNGLAPGPISQIIIHRTHPRLYLVSAGRSNHAGGGWWPLGTDTGNYGGIGFEWDNNGVGEPAHPEAVELTARAIAAIHRWKGWGLERLWTHHGYAPNRKIDPAAPALHTDGIYRTWTMAECRDLVAPFLNPESQEDMYVPLPNGPVRQIDTRVPPMERLQAGQTYDIPRHSEVPATAKALHLNLTYSRPSHHGFITAWASGERPDISVLNPNPMVAVDCNAVNVPCMAGSYKIFTYKDTDLIIDILGYYV